MSDINLIKDSDKAIIEANAIGYYNAVKEGNEIKKNECHGRVYYQLFLCYERWHSTDYERYLHDEVFEYTVRTTLAAFCPDKGDYCNLFAVALKRNKKTLREKRDNKEVNASALSNDQSAENNTDTALDRAAIDTTVNDPSEYTDSKLQAELILMEMCDIVLAKMRSGNGRIVQLHFPSVFTDDTVKLIHYDIIDKAFVQRNSARLNRVARSDFMSFFLDKECTLLEDSYGTMVKQLSEITGDPKDSDKSCRSRKKPYRLDYKVYIAYIKKVTGEEIKKEAVSQNISKYNTLIEAFNPDRS